MKQVILNEDLLPFFTIEHENAGIETFTPHSKEFSGFNGGGDWRGGGEARGEKTEFDPFSRNLGARQMRLAMARFFLWDFAINLMEIAGVGEKKENEGMSNNEDFKALEEVIKAIDPNDAKYPNMPMGIYLQEAEDLYAWAQKDLAALTAAGLDPAILEQIPVRAGAARYLQSQLNSNRFSKEEAQKQFSLLAPEAYDLKTRLIHHMLFAYRKHQDLRGRVQAIAEGSGDADMIQDLSDLSVHGKNNPEPLETIGLDMSLLDLAADKSDELATLLGIAHGERATDREVKVLRDKAYTHLKEAVDEVREFGQYVFWRDEARFSGYGSAYFRHKAKSAKKDDQPQITDAP